MSDINDYESLWKPTNELRFVRREVTILSEDKTENMYTGKYAKILQQKWVNDFIRSEEWRDIPIVNE
jgi:hypothetical protein